MACSFVECRFHQGSQGSHWEALHYGGTGVERAARGLQHCAGGLAEFVHRVAQGPYLPATGSRTPGLIHPARGRPRALDPGSPSPPRPQPRSSRPERRRFARGGQRRGALGAQSGPGGPLPAGTKPSNSDRTRPWLPLFRLREMVSAAQCFHQQHRARRLDRSFVDLATVASFVCFGLVFWGEGGRWIWSPWALWGGQSVLPREVLLAPGHLTVLPRPSRL